MKNSIVDQSKQILVYYYKLNKSPKALCIHLKKPFLRGKVENIIQNYVTEKFYTAVAHFIYK